MSLNKKLFALVSVVSLHAATGVEIWSGAELKTGTTAGKILGSYGNHSAALWRRTKSGEAELHKAKTDLLIIEQGSATLLYGGTIPDARATTPNEVRGKSIQSGESRRLSPGDVIRVPAGTPHQFILEKGEEVAYFALKIGALTPRH